MTNVTGLPPAAVTSAQGNGTKFQLSTGTTTTNDCVKFDANGNTVDAGAACGSGGGSGSVFTGSTATNPAFSATPTFSLADVSVKSPLRVEPGAMTANITSVTFTNKSAGAKFSIAWLQDGTGGRSVSYGASANNTCIIDASIPANAIITQFFEVGADGTTVNGTGCTSNLTGVLAMGGTTAPLTTPQPGNVNCWLDSTDNNAECKDSSANLYKMFKSGADANPITGVVSKINGGSFTGTNGDVVSFGASNTPADSGF